MNKIKKNDSIFDTKKLLNKHYYISKKKVKFHGFNFLITNIKNFGMKRDKSTINRLLNSSKYMVRDNVNYRSCFDLSRNIHFYPYKPNLSNSNSDKRKNTFLSSIYSKKNSSSKIIFKDFSTDNNKFILKNEITPKKKLTIPITPSNKNKNLSLSNKYSADNVSLHNSYRKIHNDFINNYNINGQKKDCDIQFLLNSLNNNSLDKNFFLNKEHLEKIAYIKYDTLSIKLKLSGLNIRFYEITNKQEKNFLNIGNYNEKINSKIKFPFEFTYFFYGLSFDSFLIFLTKIIDYNYIKNIFEINHDKFFEKYNEYKSTYSFYYSDSFIEKYNYQNTKEYFIFNWDIKVESENKNNIKNYFFKILLPRMIISIENNCNKKSIFYANIGINQLCYFLKNNFLNWDKYIFSYFSEFKLFRFVKNNLLSAGKNHLKIDIYNDKINDINNLRDLKKKVRYNLNKTNIILNNIKTNNKSYIFFFTTYNSKEKTKRTNYYLQIQLPKIYVNYKDNNVSLNKEFDIDIKTMTKLNKLRKSFNRKDIIKYCLYFIKGKNQSKFSKNNSTKKINSNVDKIVKQNSGKLLSKFSLKSSQIENIKHFIKNSEIPNEEIIDIKLNLNENIFNFDEDILKYIKVNDEEKNNDKIIQNKQYNKMDIYSTIHLNDKNIFEENKDKKLNIEIDKIQLIWIDNNNDNNSNEKNFYKFEDKETEYLFDHSSNIWRKYTENNFEKIIEASVSENRLITPTMKNSNSTVKLVKINK